MGDNGTFIFVIIGGAFLLGGIVLALWLVDKYTKTPVKPKPTPVKIQQVDNIVAPTAPVEAPEIIVSAAPTVKAEVTPTARAEKNRRSVADYHKDRWKNRNYELLSLDDATIYDQDDTEISEEDMKKILAFGDLFKKKD